MSSASSCLYFTSVDLSRRAFYSFIHLPVYLILFHWLGLFGELGTSDTTVTQANVTTTKPHDCMRSEITEEHYLFHPQKPADSSNWLTQSRDKITQAPDVGQNCLMAETAGFQMLAEARCDSETLVNTGQGKWLTGGKQSAHFRCTHSCKSPPLNKHTTLDIHGHCATHPHTTVSKWNLHLASIV